MLSKLLTTESGIVLQYGSRFYNLSTSSPCKAPLSRKYYVSNSRTITTKKIPCDTKIIKYLLSFNYITLGTEIFLTDLGITIKTYNTYNPLAPDIVFIQFNGPKEILDGFINFLSKNINL